MDARITPAQEPMRGTVLYVEDDPVCFGVVQACLSVHPDLKILPARSGHEGVQIARSQSPNVILLDMHLGDMSGLDVVRTLSEEISARKFRVVLLTGDGLTIDVVKAMSLGASEYLSKPLKPEALERSLRRWLAVAQGR